MKRLGYVSLGFVAFYSVQKEAYGNNMVFVKLVDKYFKHNF